ncbi:MAG: hypothetical protein JW788_06155 [Candidatus Omnitrophica bacterium]|nr:hypothetical protein [Candidatus Omnitrophota bacterium]
MKKIALILFISIMLVNIFYTDASAALDTRFITLAKTPVNKLFRGVINIFTFFLEIPASMCDSSHRKNMLLKTANGIVTSFVRLGTAIFDTITCVIPPYDKPILKPEFAVDSLKEKSQSVIY